MKGSQFREGYALTQRMIHFAKNLVYYLSYEVLEMQWQSFSKQLQSVTNFDEILKLHDNYLDQCLKESLMMDYNLFRTLNRINNCCVIFSNITKDFNNEIKVKVA